MAYCDGATDEFRAAQDRPYLGCSLRSMMDQVGMMILLVSTESPAWNAEVKVGDVLLEIDGKPINLIQDYYSSVAGAHGKTIELKINRKGQEMIIRVDLPPK